MSDLPETKREKRKWILSKSSEKAFYLKRHECMRRHNITHRLIDVYEMKYVIEMCVLAQVFAPSLDVFSLSVCW